MRGVAVILDGSAWHHSESASVTPSTADNLQNLSRLQLLPTAKSILNYGKARILRKFSLATAKYVEYFF